MIVTFEPRWNIHVSFRCRRSRVCWNSLLVLSRVSVFRPPVTLIGAGIFAYIRPVTVFTRVRLLLLVTLRSLFFFAYIPLRFLIFLLKNSFRIAFFIVPDLSTAETHYWHCFISKGLPILNVPNSKMNPFHQGFREININTNTRILTPHLSKSEMRNFQSLTHFFFLFP